MRNFGKNKGRSVEMESLEVVTNRQNSHHKNEPLASSTVFVSNKPGVEKKNTFLKNGKKTLWISFWLAGNQGQNIRSCAT